MDDLSLVAIIVSTGSLIVSSLGILLNYFDYFQRRRVTFLLQSFAEESSKPIPSNMSIRLLDPSKPIEQCMILWDNDILPWWDDKEGVYRMRMINAHGGANVRIPTKYDTQDGMITVRDGMKKLRRTKFSDLPIVTP